MLVDARHEGGGSALGAPSAAVGDLDADTHPELAIARTTRAGERDLIPTGPLGTTPIIMLGTGFEPATAVAAAGDVPGDGYGDLLVGDSGSQIAVYHGSPSGPPNMPDQTVLAPADYRSEIDCLHYNGFGQEVAPVGD